MASEVLGHVPILNLKTPLWQWVCEIDLPKTKAVIKVISKNFPFRFFHNEGKNTVVRIVYLVWYTWYKQNSNTDKEESADPFYVR